MIEVKVVKVRPSIRVPLRHRLRYWWWRRRLEPSTARFIDELDHRLDMAFLYGETPRLDKRRASD